jgi:hypothetical protein
MFGEPKVLAFAPIFVCLPQVAGGTLGSATGLLVFLLEGGLRKSEAWNVKSAAKVVLAGFSAILVQFCIQVLVLRSYFERY